MSKSELRAGALRSRRSLSADELSALSEAVSKRFLALWEFKDARVVASYVAKADEVQTSGIISATLAAGKTLMVPRAKPSTGELSFHSISSLSELSPGHFGVLEPGEQAEAVALDRADIVVVPIVAWDEQGHRLGYGKGYFDRSLSGAPRPMRIGLALEAQKSSSVPQSSNDIPLEVVVTERRVLRIRRGRH